MKILIKIGNAVACLLMFSPIIILNLFKELNTLDFWILLTCSICYDAYYYSILKFDNYMNEQKKLYENVLNGKTIDSETFEQKIKWYSVIGVTTIDEYFKDKK